MRILYVTTVSSTMSFFTSHINMLLDQGHTVDMASNFDLPINTDLIARGCTFFEMEFQRNPLSFQNYSGYKKLKKLIKNNDYDLVHTHTPIASVLVRIACKNIKKTKVMYTAHGFHFFKGAPLQNWLVYFPIEKWLSKYTDVLLTINSEDYNRAQKKFKAKKVEYIPGVGLDVERFNNLNLNKEAKRQSLNVPESACVILSVGELNKNKNHKTIIEAIARLKNVDIYYLICGQGPLRKDLEKLSVKLCIEKQVKFLGYRKDIAEICKIADIFAFPSKREGLGMAALEAMASGLPIVTSNIHGINDYSLNGKTGYSILPNDINGFANSINRLYNDNELREQYGKFNINKANQYSKDKVLKKMKVIYGGFRFDDQ